MPIALSENISEYIRDAFGEEYLQKYIEHVEDEPQNYIRIPKENNNNTLLKSLAQQDIVLEPIQNIEGSYKIINGKEFIGKTLEHSLGKYYIQSLSSMLPPIVLNPSSGDKTLDLCAAPGSKSTQLSELMNNKGTLYSNEPNLNRLKGLVFNADKMNKVNMGMIKYKGELLSKLFENQFDKILVDAPCSALGIVQKKNEVSNWWNINQMEKIAELQVRLLISAIKMAKVGAEIVYSTCTLAYEENELAIDKITSKYPVELVDIELPIKSAPAFTKVRDIELNPDIAKCHRIVPWETGSEGFFVCKFIKTGETAPTNKTISKEKEVHLIPSNHKKIKKYIGHVNEWFGIPMEELSKFNYILNKNDINFIDSGWESEYTGVFQRIGTKFGKIDNRDFGHLHSHGAQILGKYATKNIIELTEISEIDTYLKGGTIKKEYQPYGQKIVTYKGYIVGTAIAFKDGLKSQLPRAMRMNDIILK